MNNYSDIVHIRNAKGHKDRFVPLPDLTLQALRALWSKHRHPKLLFPNAKGSMETIRKAKNHMNKGGTQQAMKAAVAECGIKKNPYPLASALYLTPHNADYGELPIIVT